VAVGAGIEGAGGQIVATTAWLGHHEKLSSSAVAGADSSGQGSDNENFLDDALRCDHAEEAVFFFQICSERFRYKEPQICGRGCAPVSPPGERRSGGKRVFGS
jgi:hypothetical protein